MTATRGRRPFNRVPQSTQALLSGVLLLLTVPIYPRIAHDAEYAGVAFVVSGVYFAALVGLTARSGRRCRWAMAIAVVTLVAEFSMWRLAGFDNVDSGYLVAALVVAPVGYVVAWGIARRRRPSWWKAGLPMAAVLIVLSRLVLLVRDAGGAAVDDWWAWWLFWPGTVALGCAVCWLADLWATRRDNQSPPATGPSTRGPVSSAALGFEGPIPVHHGSPVDVEQPL